MPLLLDSERLRIDVNEAIGLADVSAARHDRKPAGAEGPDDVDVLESRPDRLQFALNMFEARGREPAVAVIEAAFRSADFAGAGRTGGRQSDCLVNLGLGRVGQVAAPVKPERSKFLLDLQDSKGVSLNDGGLDPGAASLQEIPPAFLAIRVTERCLGPPKNPGVSPHELDLPVPSDVRHYRPRQRNGTDQNKAGTQFKVNRSI